MAKASTARICDHPFCLRCDVDTHRSTAVAADMPCAQGELDRGEIDIAILRAIAVHYYCPLVSTMVDGYYCSFDKDELYDLQLGAHNRGFTYCKRITTPEMFHDELVGMLTNDSDAPTYSVHVPLYSNGKQVSMGLFIYYDELTQCLFGVHVHSIEPFCR